MSNTKCITIISLILLVALIVTMFVIMTWDKGYHRFVMSSSVMAPTIQKGELVFIKPFNPVRDELSRYQIIHFQPPVIPDVDWAMRIVGLPDEQVEIQTNAFLINGSKVPEDELPPALQNKKWLTSRVLESSKRREWKLGSDEVFVIGDNLATALDSRVWGPLALTNVLGIVERKANSIQIDLEPVAHRPVTLQDGRSRDIEAENQDDKKSQE